jgi:bla regulator protein blaR1
MNRMPALPGRPGRTARILSAALILGAALAAVSPAARAGEGEFEFAIIDSGNRTTISVGDLERLDGVNRLQDQARASGQAVFWFSKGGEDYVVRDPQVVERARAIVAPMQELGKKQGKLGAKQGRIGARQGQLGALEGRAGALQARIAIAGLAGGDAKDRAELDEMRAELRELRRQLDDLADEQRALGAEQRELGAQQRALGRQQAGIRNGVVADLRELAEDAIASGAAQRLP